MCKKNSNFARKIGERPLDMKKEVVLLLVVVLLIGGAIAAALWLQNRRGCDGREAVNEHGTNSVIYFDGDVPPADPLMVGHWVCTENPGWHKVYYDDFDEGYYWGKEWDESEDVQEEDLSYHGNGWFRWEKYQDTLSELSTMDYRDVPIAQRYVISVEDSSHITQIETYNRSFYHFVKQ